MKRKTVSIIKVCCFTEKAKELLEKGYTPKEVCEKCGFSTYSNFYKVFTSRRIS